MTKIKLDPWNPYYWQWRKGWSEKDLVLFSSLDKRGQSIFEATLLEFAEPIAKGSTVSWNYGKGTGTGKVVRIYREAIALTLQGSEVKRNGTEDNPALLIEQENGARVLKLLSEVRRSPDYAEPIAIDNDEGLTQKEWDAIANSVTNPAIVEQVLKDAEEAIEDGANP